MKKRTMIISTAATALLIAAGIFLSARALRRTNSEAKYIPYMEEDTEYDVMLFGTSHVLNALLPMQLWNDYGITAYNFSGHANSVCASYWELVLATTKHKPKVAVLDMLGIGWDTTSMKTEFAHLSFDVWPRSSLKREAIYDIFSSDSEREELLYPYSIYHNRWSEISLSDAADNLAGRMDISTQKGAELRYGVASPEETPLIPQDQKWEKHTIGQDYVVKFMEYCLDNDIKPLLVNVPAPEQSTAHQEQANGAADIAQQYGVPYINMMYLDLVDYDIDCYDNDSHLNPSGARKVTDYLGQYLVENYDLTDKRSDPSFEIWNEDYEAYHDYVAGRISGFNQFKVMLMAVNHSDFSGTLYVGSGYEMDEQTQKLIDNVAGNLQVVMDSDQVQPDQTRLDVYDKVRKEQCVSAVFGQDGKRVE